MAKPTPLPQLLLPPFEANLRKDKEGRTLIYDILRRKYVALTPEEWVRQHFIHFLIEKKNYPRQLLGNEISLTVGNTPRRCDSLLLNPKTAAPLIIIEYKAPHINITQNTFQQILSYNTILKATYLIVSNGLKHYMVKIDYSKQQSIFLKEIPDFNKLAY